MTAPTLTTERLTLRRPQECDFDAFAAFSARERSHWIGGPATRADARAIFDENLAHWDEFGFGYFHVALSENGEGIGRVGLRKSSARPETELAYTLYDDAHEGHGYAREAAVAVRDWAYTALGLPTLVSYIDPANLRSAALARAIGATPDAAAPVWPKHPGLTVYRYPAPEARA